MSTLLEIITDMLITAGVHDPEETIPGEIAAKCIRRVNLMLDEWALERLTFYYRVEDTLATVIGTNPYEIMTGSSTWNTARPIKIEQCFLKDGTTDYPVDCTMTQEEYNAIVDKTVRSLPKRLFYNPLYPGGMVYFDYVPDKVYTVKLFSIKPLTKFTEDDLTTELSFPPGYDAALAANGAIELGDMFKRPPTQKMMINAVNTKTNLKNSNAEPIFAADRHIPGTRGEPFNILVG